MSAVFLACGHEADVDHVRGDRRVQCGCGVVSKVTAKPVDGVLYDVSDITPAPADAGAVNLLVVTVAFLLGVAIVITLVLFGRVDDHPTQVETIAPAPARELAEVTTTTTQPVTTILDVSDTRVVRSWTWDDLAACESNGRWHLDERYDGGLQFDDTTWDAHKPAGYPPYAWQATREQQIVVAERTLAAQGAGAWPRCSYVVGMR